MAIQLLMYKITGQRVDLRKKWQQKWQHQRHAATGTNRTQQSNTVTHRQKQKKAPPPQQKLDDLKQINEGPEQQHVKSNPWTAVNKRPQSDNTR